MSVRTIAVVTSSRADFGHLYWPLRRMQEHPGIALQLLVTGSHLSPDYDQTVDLIEAHGFPVTERIPCLLHSDTDADMARAMGIALLGFASTLDRLRPDLLLIIADRYEMLSPAAAALAMRIPVAHIEGGELSEGAIDNQIRNALTALSHIHLTTTEQARQRLINMGEEPWRVHRVGAPSLDHLQCSPRIDDAVLAEELQLDLDQPIIFATYHPVTLDDDPAQATGAVLEALASRTEQILFLYPNADAGRYRIVDRVLTFCDQHDNAQMRVNLEPAAYWSLLRHVDLVYGNSSSGVMEAASLGIPAINIGRRQQGREHAGNVIDVQPNVTALQAAIDQALTPEFGVASREVENPYGDGRSADRIVEILSDVDLNDRLLEKRGVPDITPATTAPASPAAPALCPYQSSPSQA